MFKNCILFFVAFFLGYLPVDAQNAKADILRINDAYSKFTNMSMDITYRVFLNQTSTLPYETETGFYRQNGNLRYNKLKQIESLQNSNYLIVVDNELKRIVVGNPVKFDPAKITLLNLDSALSKCSSVNYINVNALQGGYSMIFKSTIVSEFEKVELYFNKKTYVVEKMVFFYRQKIRLATEENAVAERPKLEISFSQFSFEKLEDATFFSEKKFIEKNKGNYIAASSYNGYKIIDQKFLK
jgi:hypothetical protein